MRRSTSGKGTRMASQQPERRQPERRVIVSDIAKRADVSIGTVSNYLNYPERVSDTLKAKIKEAIDTLGYVPRQSHARRHTSSRGLIGYVMTDIEHSLFTDIFEGIQEVCEDNDMQVIGANASSDGVRQSELVRMFIQMGCSGIVLSTVFDSPGDVAAARSAGVPIVLVDHTNPVHADPVSSVLENNYSCGQLAVEELVRNGCTRLAFAAHSFDYQSVQDRRTGIRHAVEDCGGEVSLELINSRGLMVEDGYDVGMGLVRRAAEGRSVPDGIIVASDHLGIGIIRALVDDGTMRVPDDVSVIGCEGARMNRTAPVELTTIDAPGPDMGRKAMSELLDCIENPMTHVYSTTMLEPRLHRRASVRNGAA